MKKTQSKVSQDKLGKIKTVYQQNFVKKPYLWLRKLMLITGTLFWLTIIFVFAYSTYLLSAIPTQDEMTFPQLKALAKEKVSKKLKNNKRAPLWVNIDDVHRDLLYTVVLSEDGKYFEHTGIDYDALMNALGENIKRRTWSYGASTISQQTAKNLFLHQGKSLSRKFQEFVATKRLEEQLTKNQLLELYLNIAEFGPNIYGIAAATEYFFNKTPAEVDAAEGAFLALFLPSPRKYHYSLYQNGNWTRALRNKYKRIIDDMRYKQFISQSQHSEYIKKRKTFIKVN